MANFTQLEDSIKSYIKQNGVQAITGDILQGVLVSMLDTLATGELYAGIAKPTTDPQNPDANVFYFAWEPGTYTNFDNIVVPSGALFIIGNKSGEWELTELTFPALVQAVEEAREAAEAAAAAAASAESANQNAQLALDIANQASAKADGARGQAQAATDMAIEANQASGEARDAANQALVIAENAIQKSEKGQPGGVATLDENGMVPWEQAGHYDLVNSYLSTRTDAAATANALNQLYLFHQSEFGILQIQMSAIEEMIKGISGLGVAPLLVEMQGIGGTKAISIVTNGDWTATIDNPFVTASQTSGTGSKIITLTVAENTTDSQRTSNVLVQNAIGMELTVVVEQEARVVETRYTFDQFPTKIFFEATGGSQVIPFRSFKETYINGRPQGDQTNVAWTSTVVGAGFTFANATKTATATNNTSTSARTGTIVVTQNESSQGHSVAIQQAAGVQTIEYTAWVTNSLNLTASATSIAAAGGSSTMSTTAAQSRNKLTKWNGITVDTKPENQTITVSPAYRKVSGSGTLSSATVTFPNNTSTSGLSGVYRATYDGKTKDITISQAAGTQTFTLTLNTYTSSMPATGGSTTITGTYRVYWNGVVTQTNTSVVPSLSGSQSYFSISGNTVTATNMKTTPDGARTLSGTARYGGASAAYSITRAANVETYSSLSVRIVSNSNQSIQLDWTKASGGKTTYGTTANYTYSTGQSKGVDVSTSANYSVSAAGASMSGRVLTWANRTNDNGDARYALVTVSYGGKSTTINNGQDANKIIYGTIASRAFSYSGQIAYGGGTASPSFSYVQNISYPSGYSTQATYYAGNTQSISYRGSGTGFSVNSASGVVTASSNPNQSDRSVYVTCNFTAQGGYTGSIGAYCSQARRPGPIEVTISQNFDQWGCVLSISVSPGVYDTLNVHADGSCDYTSTIHEYFTLGSGGYVWNMGCSSGGNCGASIASINNQNSPLTTANAIYRW